MSSVINGTKPDLHSVDELDCLLHVYTREQLLKAWEEVAPKEFKTYIPYIMYLGSENGVDLFQVSGDNSFFYITGRDGAELAHKVLVEEAKKYTQDV